MKRIRATIWKIIVVAGVGLLSYCAWAIWIVISDSRPMSMPVPLVVGKVISPTFKVHSDKDYLISIEAKRRLLPETLDCMMGISTGPLDPYNCKNGKEPLLQANWILWSDGQIVDRGFSEDDNGRGGWTGDTVLRYIGAFEGQRGRKYTLEVNFVKDASALAVTDPHLNVDGPIW